MSHEKSEEMMRLLQELAVSKELDNDDTHLSTDAGRSEAQAKRARRRQEISEEMLQLAEESKSESHKPESTS